MKKIKIFQFLTTKGLTLIVFFAILINISFFVSLQPWKDDVVKTTILSGDAPGYNKLALTLLTEKSFKNFGTLRTPGYPLFVAVIYGIFGEHICVILLLQTLFNILSVILIYRITATFFSRNIALLAAFLYVLDIHQTLYAVSFLTESLFDFLFLISVYFLSRSFKMTSSVFLFLSALILGMATLVRPISIFFPAVPILLIFFLYNGSLKTKLTYMSLFGVIFIATISPWLLYNYSMYGEAKLSSISSYNILFCNVALAEVHKTGKSFIEVQDEFQKISDQQISDKGISNPIERDNIYLNIAKGYIRQNFFLYCQINLMGIINLYSSVASRQIAENFHLEAKPLPTKGYEVVSIFSKINNFIHNKPFGEIIIALTVAIYLLMNYIFSLYGLFFLLKRKENIVFLFILIILYFTLITGAVGEAIYRIPFMPFINILCAVGLLGFLTKIFKIGINYNQKNLSTLPE